MKYLRIKEQFLHSIYFSFFSPMCVSSPVDFERYSLSMERTILVFIKHSPSHDVYRPF
jgi:hypothetical protein